jgi:nitrite reductase/ring-hydroxylating ferredoxin subunit
MTDSFVRIADLNQLPDGAGKVFRLHGRLIALFRVSNSVFALDNACPHRDGPLGDGRLDGLLVTCPSHGWQIDVATGICQGRPGRRVNTYPVKIDGDAILIQLPALPVAGQDRSPVGATHALIRFGAMGYVGRFRLEQPLRLDRGSQVVVQSSRGLELGEILWGGTAESDLLTTQPDSGTVVRAVTEADTATASLFRDAVRTAFDACRELIDDRGVAVDLVDAEQLLDGQTIIFYFLGDPPPVLADITAELAAKFEAQVQFRPFGDRDKGQCGGCESQNGHGCGECANDGSCGKHHCDDDVSANSP